MSNLPSRRKADSDGGSSSAGGGSPAIQAKRTGGYGNGSSPQGSSSLPSPRRDRLGDSVNGHNGLNSHNSLNSKVSSQSYNGGSGGNTKNSNLDRSSADRLRSPRMLTGRAQGGGSSGNTAASHTLSIVSPTNYDDRSISKNGDHRSPPKNGAMSAASSSRPSPQPSPTGTAGVSYHAMMGGGAEPSVGPGGGMSSVFGHRSTAGQAMSSHRRAAALALSTAGLYVHRNDRQHPLNRLSSTLAHFGGRDGTPRRVGTAEFGSKTPEFGNNTAYFGNLSHLRATALSTAWLKSQKSVKSVVRLSKEAGIVAGMKSLVDLRPMRNFEKAKSEKLRPLTESLLAKEEQAQARGRTMLDLLGTPKTKSQRLDAMQSDEEEDDVESLGSLFGDAEAEILEEIINDELQTNGEALSNLLNTCLDSALLTVAFGLRQCGLIVGLIVMVISAYINQNNVLINLKCCLLTDTSQVSYEFSRVAFGRIGEACFVVFNTFFPFLQMVSYIFAARDAVKICLAELVFPNYDTGGINGGAGAGMNMVATNEAANLLANPMENGENANGHSSAAAAAVGNLKSKIADSTSVTSLTESPADQDFLHYLHDFLLDDTILKCGLWLLLFTPLTYKRDMGVIGAMSWFAFMAAIICCVCVVAHMVTFLLGPASQLTFWSHHSQHVKNMEVMEAGGTPAGGTAPSDNSDNTHEPPSVLSVFGDMVIGSGVLWPTGWVGLCCGIPVLALLFCGEYGAQVVLATLQDSSEGNQNRVSKLAFFFLFLLYTTIGIAGVLGAPEWEPDGNVLNSMGSTWITQLCRISACVLVILSFFIEAVPIKFVVLELLFGKDEAQEEASYGLFCGVTTVINILVLLCSLVLSNLEDVLIINSAVCVSVVGFALPAMIFIKLSEGNKLHPRFWQYYAAIAMGILVLVCGVMTVFVQ